MKILNLALWLIVSSLFCCSAAETDDGREGLRNRSQDKQQELDRQVDKSRKN